MTTKHKPDHEMEIMRRGLRDLARLPPEGRKRAVTYWSSRIEEMPATADSHGEQQLDIEDRVPMMPHLKGAAA
jgi:hypothetical protein